MSRKQPGNDFGRDSFCAADEKQETRMLSQALNRAMPHSRNQKELIARS